MRYLLGTIAALISAYYFYAGSVDTAIYYLVAAIWIEPKGDA